MESASYSNTLALLNKHEPDALLLCGSSTTGIALLARTFYGSARIVAVKRAHFDDTRGRTFVRSSARAQDKSVVDSKPKALYLAMAAANAVQSYCSDTLLIMVRN